jgi:hypothetical protein
MVRRSLPNVRPSVPADHWVAHRREDFANSGFVGRSAEKLR